METSRRLIDWAAASGYSDLQVARQDNKSKYEELEAEALKTIKKLHRDSPKYEYSEKSQSQVISEHEDDVIDLKAQYTRAPDGPLAIKSEDAMLSPEEYVMQYLEEQGFSSIFSESIPFHILFGVLMWPLIQEPSDTDLQVRAFGRRDLSASDKPEVITTLLPPDFGAPGYFARRESAIKKHLDELPRQLDQLLELFDYWLPFSEDLRQYLWAHDHDKVQIARKILSVLPIETIVSILEYLVRDYWRRYVGWPDLIAFNEDVHIFVEVKSTNDCLLEDQKRWIEDNSTYLGLPYKLVKIHKMPA